VKFGAEELISPYWRNASQPNNLNTNIQAGCAHPSGKLRVHLLSNTAFSALTLLVG